MDAFFSIRNGIGVRERPIGEKDTIFHGLSRSRWFLERFAGRGVVPVLVQPPLIVS